MATNYRPHFWPRLKGYIELDYLDSETRIKMINLWHIK